MPKFPHDDFSKTYLTELLSVIGKAIPNRPLKAETHFADLWFELDPKLASQTKRPSGYASWAAKAIKNEPLRNSPSTPRTKTSMLTLRNYSPTTAPS
jgi:hypothetical protein